MKSIDSFQLEALIDSGNPVELIDVRAPKDFEKLHALGARLEPLSDFGTTRVLCARTLPSGEPLYIMGRNEMSARLAAKELDLAGFQNAVVVQGGIEAWDQGGLPVVCGEPRCTPRGGVWLLLAAGIVLGVSIHVFFLLLALILAAGVLLDEPTRCADEGRPS